MDVREAQRTEWLREGGWTPVSPGSAYSGGLVAHRGVLHPDEYVDYANLLPVLEERLGFTLDDFLSIRKPGRPSAEMRKTRRWIEKRLTEVADAGGNLLVLSRLLLCDPKTIYRMVSEGRKRRAPDGGGSATTDRRFDG